MKSNIAREILAETPPETRQFVRRYGELVVRIHEILEEKEWSQKMLAEKMDKSPSEISKWLSGEHNFTLRSIAKLEVELGEDLIQIPVRQKFKIVSNKVIHLDVKIFSDTPASDNNHFLGWAKQKNKSNIPQIA